MRHGAPAELQVHHKDGAAPRVQGGVCGRATGDDNDDYDDYHNDDNDDNDYVGRVPGGVRDIQRARQEDAARHHELVLAARPGACSARIT